MEENMEKINNNEKEVKKNKSKKWKKINIACFIGSFTLIQLSSFLWNMLVNMNEYTLAFSMFLLFPIFAALFCLALINFGITCAIFVFISIWNIIKECNDRNRITYIIIGVEIILYVIYILNLFVI